MNADLSILLGVLTLAYLVAVVLTIALVLTGRARARREETALEYEHAQLLAERGDR